MLLIFVYVMGSWFPQWQGAAWYKLVEDIVNPYMNIFRPLKLRVGMVDLTPMVAIMLLYVAQGFVRGVMVRGGG